MHDHTARASTAIGPLRNPTSGAMQFHLASLSLKQDKSVQKLAGWGALLALPTVVFSLYGMNFEFMPELEWPWAYPTLLLATGTAVLAPLADAAGLAAVLQHALSLDAGQRERLIEAGADEVERPYSETAIVSACTALYARLRNAVRAA